MTEVSTLKAQPSWQRRLLLYLLVLVGFTLLVSALDAKSLWVDELATAVTVTEESPPAVLKRAIEGERRPPLYYLLLHYWTALAGSQDFALRYPSLFFGLLSLALVHRLGQRWGGGWMGTLAAYFLAISPFFILYSRMARSYSLTASLGLLSCLYFLLLLEKRRRIYWAGYLATSALLLYTDYVALPVLAGQNLFWLLWGRRQGPSARSWIGGQLALAISFVPWLPIVFSQTARDLTTADLATSPQGLLLKTAYPFYSFSVGETIFPWQPLAVVGAAAILFLSVVGAIHMARRDGGRLALFLIALPLLFIVFITSSFATDITFLNIPSRAIVAAPFFYLLAAAGFLALPRLWRGRWRYVLLVAITLASGYSLLNYYRNQQFHNPIYAVPAREIAQWVAADSQTEDVVISPWDSAFPYYYHSPPARARHFFSEDSQSAMAYIREHRSPRVWLITLGRDRTRYEEPTELVTWLDKEYRLELQKGYVEQDALYRRFKELLLHRPAYQYKVTVQRYVRPAS
ncbi:MAG: glycosyltransferase family 39 protein [Chloroflexi bacterium]|nr:glycosyltransferase family 39 protein [Chloroflexota bacterium]